MTRPLIQKKHIVLTALFTIYMSEYMLTLILMDKSTYGFEAVGAALHYFKMPALAAGFLLFPLSRRLENSIKTGRICYIFSNILYIAGMLVIMDLFFKASFSVKTASLLITLLALGFLGGAVYYYVAVGFMGHPFLGRLMGIGGACSFLIQMTVQYLIPADGTFIILLLIGFALTAYVSFAAGEKYEWMFDESLEYASKGDTSLPGTGKIVLGVAVMMLFYLIYAKTDTILISMNFAGDMAIYGWPRLGGAVGYLLAGFLSDLGKRKWLMVCAFCMTVLCISIPFMINEGFTYAAYFLYYVLVVCRIVYMNMFFWILAPMTSRPELWAGMSRTLSCVLEVIHPLFSGISVLSALVLETVFLAAALCCIAFGGYLPGFGPMVSGQSSDSDARPDPQSEKTSSVSAEDHLKIFAENSGLTPRETEFLEALIMTDTDVEGIARSFGLTARTVHRHISNIYEKTGTDSRYALMRCFYESKEGALSNDGGQVIQKA